MTAPYVPDDWLGLRWEAENTFWLPDHWQALPPRSYLAVLGEDPGPVPVIAIDPDRYLLVLVDRRMAVLDLGRWLKVTIDDSAPTMVDILIFGRRAQIPYRGMVLA